MAWWKRKRSTESKTWNLPGNVGTVAIPNSFVIEWEDEQTLLAAACNDRIVFRFSSISFTKKDAGLNAAKDVVRGKADEHSYLCAETSDRAIISYESESEQDGTPLAICWWEVGQKNTLVIVSATMTRNDRRDRQIREVLQLGDSIVASVQVTKQHAVLEHDGHSVTITEESVESQPQQVNRFTAADEEWLRESLRVAAELGIKYSSGGALTPEELDVVFSRWMNEPDGEEADVVANALGAAFGDYLVSEHGFAWVVVQDDYGTEYAIRHPCMETMAFPRASVFKRIESRQPDCFCNLRTVILGTVARGSAD